METKDNYKEYLFSKVDMIERDYKIIKEANYKKYVSQRKKIVIGFFIIALITNYLNYILTH